MEESTSKVRLITWNVNGIRSLYKSSLDIKEGLDSLEADVICFQETKVSRDALEESTAIVEGYSSYYAFPRNRSGYSGVATYCTKDFTPFKAEEGLSDIFSSEIKDAVGCYSNINSKFSRSELKELDSEGRAVITQHKFTEQFNANPCRLWLNHIIWDPNKVNSTETKYEDAHLQLIDAYRYLHPMQENAFTCWSTQLNARVTNYGTRIDYILIDNGLKASVEDCSILRDVTGSDHCPVRIVFNVNGLHSPNLPSFCTKFYPEFSGTQKKLFEFYKRIGASTTMQHKEEHENSNPVGERKHKPVLKETEAKRQKGIEQFLIKRTVLLENVSTSSSLVKIHSSDIAESPHQEDCVITKNTVSTSSVNFPNTSCCEASVSDVKNLADLKEENTQGLKPFKSAAAQNWKKMFTGPKPPPRCRGHNEPCVQRCVKKKGPNFNRKFWVCARGEGHSGDPLARCNFFLWDSQR